MNYDEFQKKYIGKAVDYDGVAGVQCVDLADQYLKDCFGITGVWCNGARDLYNNFASYPALVGAFDRVPNTRDLVVQKGDIVIWGGGSWGHVAIGTGEGDEDWFMSIEQNTLGRHEPTQLVKHYFANDPANPCLGVLRPKEQGGADNALKPLDTEQGKPIIKRGDHGLDVIMLKDRLKALGYTSLDDTDGFGDGTEKAVNSLLKKWGYKQNGVVGKKFSKIVMR